MTTSSRDLTVHLRRPHPKQDAAIHDGMGRSIWRAGRRGGKTTAACNKAVEGLLALQRVLYATPTSYQLGRFWTEVKRALTELIEHKLVVVNETMHSITIPGQETRILAKTAYNADGLRGDYADLVILDEYQLMSEDTWDVVVQPMLADNNGDAVFIYTPPSLHSRSASKARDKRHAAKFWAAHVDDSDWGCHHWTSHDNPHISEVALERLSREMTRTAWQQEIMAEDVDEAPGALWTNAVIEEGRVWQVPEKLARIVVGVDPPGGVTECGIVAVGVDDNRDLYVLADNSMYGSPETWAGAVIDVYNNLDCDRIVGEVNFGGDMVQSTIRAAAHARSQEVSYKSVRASRGKAVRAEPIAAAYEQGRIHHVGNLPALEEELTGWVPGFGPSPNRMDALVWACTEIGVLPQPRPVTMHDLIGGRRNEFNPLGLDLSQDKYVDRDLERRR